RLLAQLFGQADRGNLRPAIRRPWLLDIAHRLRVRVPSDRLRGKDALVAGGVGEHQPADGITNGVQMRLSRTHRAQVDLDEPLVELGLRRLEPDILDVRGST